QGERDGVGAGADGGEGVIGVRGAGDDLSVAGGHAPGVTEIGAVERVGVADDRAHVHDLAAGHGAVRPDVVDHEPAEVDAGGDLTGGEGELGGDAEGDLGVVDVPALGVERAVGGELVLELDLLP